MANKLQSEENTVSFTDCIRVEVRGELAGSFMEYCLKNKIYSMRAGMSGPGIHIGFYLLEHRAKIESFFDGVIDEE